MQDRHRQRSRTSNRERLLDTLFPLALLAIPLVIFIAAPRMSAPDAAFELPWQGETVEDVLAAAGRPTAAEPSTAPGHGARAPSPPRAEAPQGEGTWWSGSFRTAVGGTGSSPSGGGHPLTEPAPPPSHGTKPPPPPPSTTPPPTESPSPSPTESPTDPTATESPSPTTTEEPSSQPTETPSDTPPPHGGGGGGGGGDDDDDDDGRGGD
jgi:hypothetical protein